jgi:hypothetical protein
MPGRGQRPPYAAPWLIDAAGIIESLAVRMRGVGEAMQARNPAIETINVYDGRGIRDTMKYLRAFVEGGERALQEAILDDPGAPDLTPEEKPKAKKP